MTLFHFATGTSTGNLAITHAEDGWQPGSGTTTLLNVADCAQACTELRQRGVRCDDPAVMTGRCSPVT